ncbi:hypothetical protein LXA43DRAFT_54235 [Ganoderma leucocontextum]|nr:hypothetical protein LXA43DRAFT_54235 [Ganoderma leucocontextum]
MTLWGRFFTQPNALTSSAAHDHNSGKSAREPVADRAHTEEPSRSPLRTVLIFSAILVPFAAVPYILLHRQYHQILKEVTSLRVANESLAREMRRFTTAEAPTAQKSLEEILMTVREHKAKLEANGVALAEVKESLDVTRARLEDSQGRVDGVERNVMAEVQGIGRALSKAQRAGVEQHKMRTKWQEDMKLKLAHLAAENTRWRSTVGEDVRETGMSLANLAGFVDEIERREGWTPLPNDGRGIHRTRNLAKRLDEYGQSTMSSEQDDCEAVEDTEPSHLE